jgi:hypothetical protein
VQSEVTNKERNMKRTLVVIVIIVVGLGFGVGAAFGVSRLLPQQNQGSIQTGDNPVLSFGKDKDGSERSLPGNRWEEDGRGNWQFNLPMMPESRSHRQVDPNKNLPRGRKNGQEKNQFSDPRQEICPMWQNRGLPAVPPQVNPVPQLPQVEPPSAGATRKGQISMDEAMKIAQNAVAGKPDLLVGKVMEFQRGFYALILEKDTNRGGFELLIDANRGRAVLEPGVGMMWNLKYGRPNNDTLGENTLSMSDALQDAQIALDKQAPGANVVEAGVSFYGYYTFEYTMDGKTAGLVSVNAMNGEAWLHTWLGTFVQAKVLP